MTDPIDQFLDDSAYDDEDDHPIHPPMVVNRDQLENHKHHENVIQNAKDDYEFVRTNLKQIVETNVKALEGLAKVAQESESPRAYEVLSSFMKQMADANESLMKLHKDAKEITTQPGEGGNADQPGGGTTNNYFAGSTEDLLDLVEKMEQKGTPLTIEGDVSEVKSD